MAEILAIVGGVSSFAQVLAYAATASKALTEFSIELRDAPFELHRIRDQVVFLRSSLENLKQHLNSFDDGALLPPDLRPMVRKAIRSVWDCIIELQRQCPISEESCAESPLKRLKWTFKERHVAHKLVERLKDADNTLAFVLRLLSLCVTPSIICVKTIMLTKDQTPISTYKQVCPTVYLKSRGNSCSFRNFSSSSGWCHE